MGRAKKQLQLKEPVTIRYKECKGGRRSIYLDCYVKGKRWPEFLSKEIGYLYPQNTTDYSERAHNAEVLQRANAKKMQRISEIYAGKDSAQKAAKNGKMLLQDWMDIYIQKQLENGNKGERQLSYTKRILLAYAGEKAQMQDIDKNFCLGFLKFIKHLRVNRGHKDIKSLEANSELSEYANPEHYITTRNRDIIKNKWGYWEKLHLSKQEIAEKIEQLRREDKEQIETNKDLLRMMRAHRKKFTIRTEPLTDEELLFKATHKAISLYEGKSAEYKVREASARDIAKAEPTFISPTTQHIYYVCFCAALNEAVRAEIILSNPFDKIASADKIKVPASKREYLTIDEVKQLIATDYKRENIKNAFLFSCFCGLRYSDICAITWGQIIQDGEQMRLQLKMQKTQEMLYLPISEQAQKFLPNRGTASANDPIFHMFSEPQTNNNLAKWAKAAGITKKVTFHVARHTFATMMLTLGADLYTTSKLLGHKNVETTQIYAKIINKKKDEAVNLTNGIF